MVGGDLWRWEEGKREYGNDTARMHYTHVPDCQIITTKKETKKQILILTKDMEDNIGRFTHNQHY